MQKPSTETSPGASVNTPLLPDKFNFFPHLPPYSDPTTGFISCLPKSWIPYAQLMRLDRPAGFYAFYFPYLIALAYAACIAPNPPAPLHMLKLVALLLPFNILLRGAACTWNGMSLLNCDPSNHLPLSSSARHTTYQLPPLPAGHTHVF